MNKENKLLIVDDELFILNSLKRMLRKEPYTVFFVNSGYEALSVMERERVQVIIADQRMPGMTGVELLEKIGEIDPDSVRIIFSGYSDFTAIQEAINRGRIFRFLSKPCDNEEFKKVIESAFEQRRILEENKRIMDQLIQENVKLKHDLSDRDKSLLLTQEILDIIETPLFVLDKKFKIALKNSAAQSILESMREDKLIHRTNEELFTKEYTELIEDCLHKGNSSWRSYNIFGKKQMRLQIRALRSHDHYSCVLILKEKE